MFHIIAVLLVTTGTFEAVLQLLDDRQRIEGSALKINRFGGGVLPEAVFNFAQ